MSESFLMFFRRLWMSALPMQLVRSILVAALFEILVYVIIAGLRKALSPALARDAAADAAHRVQRRRVVVGIPAMLVRAVMYTAAIMIILRIFRFRSEQDLYPIALGLLVLVAIGARNILRDAFAGYFIHYDYLYAVGDEITVGQYSGMVSEISLRYTKLRTRDGQEIVIGNNEARTLINRTGPQRREREQ